MGRWSPSRRPDAEEGEKGKSGKRDTPHHLWHFALPDAVECDSRRFALNVALIRYRFWHNLSTRFFAKQASISTQKVKNVTRKIQIGGNCPHTPTTLEWVTKRFPQAANRLNSTVRRRFSQAEIIPLGVYSLPLSVCLIGRGGGRGGSEGEGALVSRSRARREVRPKSPGEANGERRRSGVGRGTSRT